MKLKILKRQIAYLKSIIEDRAVLIGEIIKELKRFENNMAMNVELVLKVLLIFLLKLILIPEEDVVVTLTRKGYIKRVPLEYIWCAASWW